MKATAHWLLVAGRESWPLDRLSPSPAPVASLQNKANFPFHQPHLFISFWAASSRTPLSVTGWAASWEGVTQQALCEWPLKSFSVWTLALHWPAVGLWVNYLTSSFAKWDDITGFLLMKKNGKVYLNLNPSMTTVYPGQRCLWGACFSFFVYQVE